MSGMTKGAYGILLAVLLVFGIADWLAINLVVGPAWIASAAAPAEPSSTPAAPPTARGPAPPAASFTARVDTTATHSTTAPAPSGRASAADTQVASATARPPAPAPPTAAGPVAASYTFQFTKNSYALSADARKVLRSVADQLRADLRLRARFEGHADENGTKAVNDWLSLERARAARAYIAALGLDAGRVEIEGFGSDRPLDRSRSEEAFARNRRVEVFVK